jgi:LacI family transcriptional regulator
MTTIKDVARRAGVAPITASRVINNSGYASEDVRRRVLQAAETLGYTPNALARSLRSNQTRTLALVLTDVTNPFWTTVARGVEDTASEAGFNVILCNTDESEIKQEAYIETLVQKRVDGMLLVPAGSHPQPITYLRQHGVPVVVLDRCLPGLQVDSVRSDSLGGAYELTRLLLSLGHRQIAVISGPHGVSTAEDRVAGYRQALAEAGVTPLDAWIRYGTFTIESGQQMMGEILSLPERPTALFACNNFLAIGALQALRQAGLNVPNDISVAGFDDLPAAMVVDPFLTAAAQPAYEMGQRATLLLLDRLGKEKPTSHQEIILPVAILRRGSTQPIGGSV